MTIQSVAVSPKPSLKKLEMDTIQPFAIHHKSSLEERTAALQQIYTQVFERQPYEAERKEIALQEKNFLNGKLAVRQFLKELGHSNAYLSNFFDNRTNLEFLESCFQHFLGRLPFERRELVTCSGILIKHGCKAVIDEIVDSEEYHEAFGNFTVPYARRVHFPPSLQNFWYSPKR